MVRSTTPMKESIGRPPVWGLVLTTLWLTSLPAGAQVSEHELKAVFLFNFVSFIGWPKDSHQQKESAITIGVAGDPDFLAILQRTIAGERVDDRPLIAKALDRDEDLDQCHVVYVGAKLLERTSAILARARGRNVLTVGETENFTSAGGVIGFRLEKNRVRFLINLEAASEANLRISSQLLKLADIVPSDRERVR